MKWQACSGPGVSASTVYRILFFFYMVHVEFYMNGFEKIYMSSCRFYMVHVEKKWYDVWQILVNFKGKHR